MGHHLSKQTINNKQTTTTKSNQKKVDQQIEISEFEQTINLEIDQEEEEEEEEGLEETISNSPSPRNNLAGTAEVRQIIIKIQLAKMENGNNVSADDVGGQVLEQEVQQQQQQQTWQGVAGITEGAGMAAIMSATDTLNANERRQQILNVTLGGRTAGSSSLTATTTTTTTTEAQKTERQQMNNNNLEGIANVTSAISTLQLNNDEVAAAAVAAAEHLHHQDHQYHHHHHNHHHHHHHQHQHHHHNHDDDDGVHDGDDDNDDDVVDESLLRRRDAPTTEAVDYCEVEVLETLPVSEMLSTGTQQIAKSNNGNSCCRSRSSKILSMGANTSSNSSSLTTTTTAAAAAGGGGGTAVGGTSTQINASKRRCCKCKCRDALKGIRSILESSSNTLALRDKNKETTTMRKSSSSSTRPLVDRRSTPVTTSTSNSTVNARLQAQRKRNSVAVVSPTANVSAVTAAAASVGNVEPGRLAIWTGPTNGDVIIRISSPQCLIESSPVNARVTVGPHIRLVATDQPTQVAITPISRPKSTGSALPSSGLPFRVTVHSQIDFMHCLVPDLEKIINSSFYWGKMDRYEAERLLEGKPEGTFLLRDSAQEEFLFSVTFRKYGRSLHARIEQSGHKFSFDCHDPCVFTAGTVTGLLEHYKDPTCVMFFEPCLTMPLHRRQTFSLQQLARATIVSNTSYDGINQLELPGRLKSYLKEYHYKQKLRVKPCDQHTPGAFYGNV